MDFQSFDNKTIFVYEWASVAEPKGIVQIVHGMAEHAGRYEAFAKYLNSFGYIVVADDHRGHGRTDEDSLGYFAGDIYESILKDEEELTRYYQKRYVGLKYFLFGFSFGSFLAQSMLSRSPAAYDGVVLGGSSYKKDAQVYLGSMICALVNLFKKEKVPAGLLEELSFGAYKKKFGNEQWLSLDNDNNKKYLQDPLCGFTCSYAFYRDFFKGLKKLYTKKYREGLRQDLPLLIVSGKNDAVGNMGKGVQKLSRFYREKAGVKSVETLLFEHSRHEFLNEQMDRDLKWGSIKEFFDRICEESI